MGNKCRWLRKRTKGRSNHCNWNFEQWLSELHKRFPLLLTEPTGVDSTAIHFSYDRQTGGGGRVVLAHVECLVDPPTIKRFANVLADCVEVGNTTLLKLVTVYLCDSQCAVRLCWSFERKFRVCVPCVTLISDEVFRTRFDVQVRCSEHWKIFNFEIDICMRSCEVCDVCVHAHCIWIWSFTDHCASVINLAKCVTPSPKLVIERIYQIHLYKFTLKHQGRASNISMKWATTNNNNKNHTKACVESLFALLDHYQT